MEPTLYVLRSIFESTRGSPSILDRDVFWWPPLSGSGLEKEDFWRLGLMAALYSRVGPSRLGRVVVSFSQIHGRSLNSGLSKKNSNKLSVSKWRTPPLRTDKMDSTL